MSNETKCNAEDLDVNSYVPLICKTRKINIKIMNNETKQTEVPILKLNIQDKIEFLSGKITKYESGYKQCLIDLQNELDDKILEMVEEKNKNIPIYIYEGVPNICIYIEDGIIHVKPNNETYGGNK